MMRSGRCAGSSRFYYQESGLQNYQQGGKYQRETGTKYEDTRVDRMSFDISYQQVMGDWFEQHWFGKQIQQSLFSNRAPAVVHLLIYLCL